MKFLIVGRTATGKDKLASILQDKYEWKFVSSFTDRPKRYEEENTHTFITTEEFHTIDSREIVAETLLNGYHYCATKTQLQESDAYIVDPRGCYQVLQRYPEQQFIIVYLEARDKTQQRFFALARNSHNPSEELQTFNARVLDEDSQFQEFESELANYNFVQYANVVQTISFLNTYKENDLIQFAESLQTLRQTQ